MEVTGTIAMPNPTPAMGSVQPMVDKPELGVRTTSVRMIPIPASAQPTVIGSLGPDRATQRPVRSEAMTIAAAIGAKSSAVP